MTYKPTLSTSQQDQEILNLNQALLESVVRGDWSTYSSHCRNDLTCFEAETNGVLAEGLPFHQFYFDLPNEPVDSQNSAANVTPNVSMAGTHLRWLSDNAVVLSYTRLTQSWQGGEAVTASCCETRIWQKIAGEWKQVHVHRS